MLPCKDCAYMQRIPGNCHIRCMFDWNQATEKQRDNAPRNQLGGKTMQWFKFPFNYDPVWGQDECPAFAKEADKSKIAETSPLADLLSLLG